MRYKFDCERRQTMATKSKVIEEKDENNEAYPFFDAARKILLAGIGAIAITHDEIEVFIIKLVERGEIAKKDGEKLIREVMDRRKKTIQGVEGDAYKRMNEILDHFNMPTKNDIDDLSEKIAVLAKKIDELNKGKD
jgi:poly(hydroxyalkanoate) granule-associated protein